MYEAVFDNGFISLVWNDVRLDVLDSDGNFIDYVIDIENYEEDEVNKILEETIQEIKNISEEDTVKWLKGFGTIRACIPNCSSYEITKLKDAFGDEWVNRVGSTAVIIKES